MVTGTQAGPPRSAALNEPAAAENRDETFMSS